jgi:hypothetical protein
MKEDIVLTLAFLVAILGISTCSDTANRSCDIIHPAGTPAHRCEEY